MFVASNKSDVITFGVDGGITIEIDKDRKSVIIGCHTHANMATLDRITESDWLKLVTQTHTHTNIEVLHALTPANLADIQTNFRKKTLRPANRPWRHPDSAGGYCGGDGVNGDNCTVSDGAGQVA